MAEGHVAGSARVEITVDASQVETAIQNAVETALASIKAEVPVGFTQPASPATPATPAAGAKGAATTASAQGVDAKVNASLEPKGIQDSLNGHKFKIDIDAEHLRREIQNALTGHKFQIEIEGLPSGGRPATPIEAPSSVARSGGSPSLGAAAPEVVQTPAVFQRTLDSVTGLGSSINRLHSTLRETAQAQGRQFGSPGATEGAAFPQLHDLVQVMGPMKEWFTAERVRSKSTGQESTRFVPGAAFDRLREAGVDPAMLAVGGAVHSQALSLFQQGGSGAGQVKTAAAFSRDIAKEQAAAPPAQQVSGDDQSGIARLRERLRLAEQAGDADRARIIQGQIASREAAPQQPTHQVVADAVREAVPAATAVAAREAVPPQVDPPRTGPPLLVRQTVDQMANALNTSIKAMGTGAIVPGTRNREGTDVSERTLDPEKVAKLQAERDRLAGRVRATLRQYSGINIPEGMDAEELRAGLAGHGPLPGIYAQAASTPGMSMAPAGILQKVLDATARIRVLDEQLSRRGGEVGEPSGVSAARFDEEGNRVGGDYSPGTGRDPARGTPVRSTTSARRRGGELRTSTEERVLLAGAPGEGGVEFAAGRTAAIRPEDRAGSAVPFDIDPTTGARLNLEGIKARNQGQLPTPVNPATGFSYFGLLRAAAQGRFTDVARALDKEGKPTGDFLRYGTGDPDDPDVRALAAGKEGLVGGIPALGLSPAEAARQMIQADTQKRPTRAAVPAAEFAVPPGGVEADAFANRVISSLVGEAAKASQFSPAGRIGEINQSQRSLQDYERADTHYIKAFQDMKLAEDLLAELKEGGSADSQSAKALQGRIEGHREEMKRLVEHEGADPSVAQFAALSPDERRAAVLANRASKAATSGLQHQRIEDRVGISPHTLERERQGRLDEEERIKLSGEPAFKIRRLVEKLKEGTIHPVREELPEAYQSLGTQLNPVTGAEEERAMSPRAFVSRYVASILDPFRKARGITKGMGSSLAPDEFGRELGPLIGQAFAAVEAVSGGRSAMQGGGAGGNWAADKAGLTGRPSGVNWEEQDQARREGREHAGTMGMPLESTAQRERAALARRAADTSMTPLDTDVQQLEGRAQRRIEEIDRRRKEIQNTEAARFAEKHGLSTSRVGDAPPDTEALLSEGSLPADRLTRARTNFRRSFTQSKAGDEFRSLGEEKASLQAEATAARQSLRRTQEEAEALILETSGQMPLQGPFLGADEAGAGRSGHGFKRGSFRPAAALGRAEPTLSGDETKKAIAGMFEGFIGPIQPERLAAQKQAVDLIEAGGGPSLGLGPKPELTAGVSGDEVREISAGHRLVFDENGRLISGRGIGSSGPRIPGVPPGGPGGPERPVGGGFDGFRGGVIHVIVDNTPLPITWEGAPTGGGGGDAGGGDGGGEPAEEPGGKKRKPIRARRSGMGVNPIIDFDTSGDLTLKGEIDRTSVFARERAATAANKREFDNRQKVFVNEVSTAAKAEEKRTAELVEQFLQGNLAEDRRQRKASGSAPPNLTPPPAPVAQPPLTPAEQQAAQLAAQRAAAQTARLPTLPLPPSLLPPPPPGDVKADRLASGIAARRERLGLGPITTDLTGPSANAIDEERADLSAEAEAAQRKILRRGFTASVTDIIQAPFFKEQNANIDRFQRESRELIKFRETEAKAIQTYTERAREAAGVQQELSQATDPGQRLALVRDLSIAEGLRNDALIAGAHATREVANQEEIVQEGRTRLPGRRESLQNLAVGSLASGGAVALGSIVFQLTSQVLAGVQEVLFRTLEPIGDKLTGFATTLNTVTAALDDATRAAHGNAEAVAAQAAISTGLSQPGADLVQATVGSRATIEAGNKTLKDQADLLNAVQASMNAEMRGQVGAQTGPFQPGGGIPGLTRSTGGILGSPLLATPSTTEQIVSALPSTQALSSLGGMAMGMLGRSLISGGTNSIGSPQEFIAQIGEFANGQTIATERLKFLSDAAERGGSKLEILTTATDDQRKSFEEAGRAIGIGPDQLAAFRDSGVAVGGPGGETVDAKGLQDFLQAIVKGINIPDPETMLAELRGRAGQAQIGALEAQTALQLRGNSAQFAMSNLAQPARGLERALFPGGDIGAAVPDAVIQTYNDLKDAAGAAFGDIEAGVTAGRKELESFGLSEADILQIEAAGKAIKDIQSGPESGASQAIAANYADFEHSLEISKRTLGDIVGLNDMLATSVEGVGEVQATNLGIQERIVLEKSRELTLLGQEMTQRQINFRVAIAGFSTQGLTPEERAARQDQAQFEASIAQKQLNLQKGITGAQFKIVDEQNLRAFNDFVYQIEKLPRDFGIQVKLQGEAVLIEALSRTRDKIITDANTTMGKFRAMEELAIATAATIAQQTDEAFDSLLKKSRRTIAEISQEYAAAIGAAPGTGAGNPAPGEPGHDSRPPRDTGGPGTPSVYGQGSVVIQFGDVHVRNNQDLDAITDAVERALNRKSRLLGLSAPVGS